MIDETKTLLADLKEFEDNYVLPYVKQIESLNGSRTKENIAKIEKAEKHLKFLSNIVHLVRVQIELNAVREVHIAELVEGMEASKILRNGKVKITFKEQAQRLIPLLQKLADYGDK